MSPDWRPSTSRATPGVVLRRSAPVEPVRVEDGLEATTGSKPLNVRAISIDISSTSQ